MSRPSSSRRHSLKVLVARLAIAAVAALTLPKNTSIDIGIAGYDKCYGKGRVDALRAVTQTTTAVHEANGCSDY